MRGSCVRLVLTVCAALVLGAFLGAGPSRACEPPSFPTPAKIGDIQLIQARHGKLTDEEMALLDDYNKDRTAFMDLYEQAFPCPMFAGDEDRERMYADNSEEIKKQLLSLEKKWQEAVSESLTDTEGGSNEPLVTIDPDESLVVE